MVTIAGHRFQKRGVRPDLWLAGRQGASSEGQTQTWAPGPVLCVCAGRGELVLWQHCHTFPLSEMWVQGPGQGFAGGPKPQHGGAGPRGTAHAWGCVGISTAVCRHEAPMGKGWKCGGDIGGKH